MNRANTLYRVSNSNSDTKFDESAALGILQHLDKDTLQQLSDNDDKLKDYVNDLPEVKRLESDKEMLIASNKSLAEYNLTKQPKLNQGREMLSLEYDRVARLKEEYDSLVTQIASSNQTASLDLAHALLQTKAADSEEQTDRLGDMFINREVNCDEFLEQYIESRIKVHQLKIKSEKLGEMIQRNVNHASWGAEAVNPPRVASSGSMSSQSNTVPYPMYSGMQSHFMSPVSN